MELLERICVIWNAFCTWICELFASKPENRGDISQLSPDSFYIAMHYLLPEEVATCERVCKSWKIPDKVWKAQCANIGVTSAPVSGRYKDVFDIPKMAFGPREYMKQGWGEPGPMPRLPANIAVLAARLKETHTLTLIPATVDGRPFNFNAFAPLAERSGKRFDIRPTILTKFGNESNDKSIWLWMPKEIDSDSRSLKQRDAESQYGLKLGKAFWITVSVVAHYARYQISLFPRKDHKIWTFTRTRDELGTPGDNEILVGCPNKDFVTIVPSKGRSPSVGVAPCYS